MVAVDVVEVPVPRLRHHRQHPLRREPGFCAGRPLDDAAVHGPERVRVRERHRRREPAALGDPRGAGHLAVAVERERAGRARHADAVPAARQDRCHPGLHVTVDERHVPDLDARDVGDRVPLPRRPVERDPGLTAPVAPAPTSCRPRARARASSAPAASPAAAQAPGQPQPVVRAGRLEREPLVEQGPRQPVVPAAVRGLDARHVDEVALRVRAAEPRRDVPHRQQVLEGLVVAAGAERPQRQGGRQADVPRHHRVGPPALRRPAQGAEQGGRRRLVAQGGERHHRVGVVERVPPVVDVAAPGVGDLAPPVADVHLGEPQPPEQRGRVEQVEQLLAAVAPDPGVVDVQDGAGLLEVEVVEREVPPVVDREEVVARPVVLARRQPRDAVRQAALHLVRVRDGVHRPGVPRVELHRVRARAPRPRCSRPSPRGRTRTCRGRTRSPGRRGPTPAAPARRGRAATGWHRGRSRPGARR